MGVAKPHPAAFAAFGSANSTAPKVPQCDLGRARGSAPQQGVMGRQQYVPRLRACYGLRQGLSIDFGNQRFRLVVFVTV